MVVSYTWPYTSEIKPSAHPGISTYYRMLCSKLKVLGNRTSSSKCLCRGRAGGQGGVHVYVNVNVYT